MRLGDARKAVTAGLVLAAALIPAAPIAAHAQAVTCSPGTAVVVRAVGSPRAPMLVPAQVPVNICSQNGQVVGVIPAFQAIGPSGAPLIVPTQTLTRTCAPTVVTSTPVVGGGLSSPLQFAQVGSGTVTINVAGGGTMTVPVITSLPATTVSGATGSTTPAVITVVPSTTVVTTTPTAFTCF